MYIIRNFKNYTVMSSAWQLPYATLYLALRQAIQHYCTSELFKFQSSQPYICIQKVECTLSKVSLSQMLDSLNIITLLLL